MRNTWYYVLVDGREWGSNHSLYEVYFEETLVIRVTSITAARSICSDEKKVVDARRLHREGILVEKLFDTASGWRYTTNRNTEE